MSDDTTRTDEWGSPETSSDTAERSASATSPTEAQRVGFCQDCGKALSAETVRSVGTGVFCEPCLSNRVGSSPSASGYTTVPPYAAVPPQPVAANDPSPTLAAVLGLIPGV